MATTQLQKRTIQDLKGYEKLQEELANLNNAFGLRGSVNEDHFISLVNAQNVALHVAGRVLFNNAENDAQKKQIIDLLNASNKRFEDEFVRDRKFDLKGKDVDTEYKDQIKKSTDNYKSAQNGSTTIKNVLEKVFDIEGGKAAATAISEQQKAEREAAVAASDEPTVKMAAVNGNGTGPVSTTTMPAPVTATPAVSGDELVLPMAAQVERHKRRFRLGFRATTAVIVAGAIALGAVGYTGSHDQASASTVQKNHAALTAKLREKVATYFWKGEDYYNLAFEATDPMARQSMDNAAIRAFQAAGKNGIKISVKLRRDANRDIGAVQQELGYDQTVLGESEQFEVSKPTRLQPKESAAEKAASEAKLRHETEAERVIRHNERVSAIKERDFVRISTDMNAALGIVPNTSANIQEELIYSERAVAQGEVLVNFLRKEDRTDAKDINRARRDIMAAMRQDDAAKTDATLMANGSTGTTGVQVNTGTTGVQVPTS